MACNCMGPPGRCACMMRGMPSQVIEIALMANAAYWSEYWRGYSESLEYHRLHGLPRECTAADLGIETTPPQLRNGLRKRMR